MNKYELPSRYVKADKIMEVVFAVSYQKLTIKEISKFIDMSEPYVSACLSIARQLEMIEQLSQNAELSEGSFIAIQEIRETIRKIPIEKRSLLMHKYLHRFKPFLEFVLLIGKEYSTDESARMVKVLYNFHPSEDIVRKQLVELGKYTEILKTTNSKNIEINLKLDQLSTQYIKNLQDAIKAKTKVILFIRERLSDKIFSFLDPEIIEEFAQALQVFQNDPRNAIGAIGRAVEDFLRTMGNTHGKRKYTKAKGIGQIVDLMRGEKLILPAHQSSAHFLGGVRNASGGHGKDKETFKRWDVSPEAALETILIGLSHIKSVYKYIVEGEQVL